MKSNRHVSVTITIEHWKAISGCTTYEVSNKGRVRRRANNHILKPWLAKRGGYPAVRLGNGTPNKMIHALVLTAFRSPRPMGLEACHKDGNPLNNRINNLYWGDAIQ